MRTRRARLAVLLLATVVGAQMASACAQLPAAGDDVLGGSYVPGGGAAAYFAMPTSEYAHGVLGDQIEARELVIDTTLSARDCGDRIVLGGGSVFEDVAPRLVDISGDGWPEVIVVESHPRKGARISVYGYKHDDYSALNLIAATEYIGTRFRWRAPFAIADLDNDGFVEIAEIDRPHLAKTLRIWRFKDDELEPVAARAGLTNHRIGERDIGGGIRDCGNGPEMITASADWRRVIASRLEAGEITTRDLGAHTGRASLNKALDCQAL